MQRQHALQDIQT